MDLSGEEIELAQTLINERQAGTYELEQIFGEIWATIDHPTGYGRRFKKAVLSGLLAGIEWEGRNVQNHQLYRITGRANPSKASA